MKKIGLVGGISWSSTLDYYRLINEEVNKKLGGSHFAECIIYSVNFELFHTANARHDWDATYQLMLNAALRLKDAGAELILLGANTAHIVAERVAEKVQLPFIDIRDATAKAIQAKKMSKVGLIGTTYTMELDFYKRRIEEYEIEVMIPPTQEERDFIEETLVHELGQGIITEKTKQEYIKIANRLIENGAEGIILGCTEIPLILEQKDFAVPVFNTTLVHVQAAVAFASESLISTTPNYAS